MIAQKLDVAVTCYRIGDPNGAYPVFSSEGSRKAPGRWNSQDTPVIYACEHYSTAMLEKLVHGSGKMPPNQHFIEITIPNQTTYEVVNGEKLPGWYEADQIVSRSFGAQWVRECRSAILIVPSVVARLENNVIINPAHANFANIKHGLNVPIWWDKRLFSP